MQVIPINIRGTTCWFRGQKLHKKAADFLKPHQNKQFLLERRGEFQILCHLFPCRLRPRDLHLTWSKYISESALLHLEGV